MLRAFLFMAFYIIVSCGVIGMSWAESIDLPAPDVKGGLSVEEAIAKRRSVRTYSRRDLTLEALGQLLWAGQGITNKRGLRSSPSAGALYPLELYLLTKDGLYHYIPEGHKLEVMGRVDLRANLRDAALGQEYISEAPADIVIAAAYSRVTGTYGKRGEDYVLIEVGHAAENIHLQAVSMGLASVPIGAFDSGSVASLLSLPRGQTPIYIIPVGYPQDSRK